MPSTRAIIFDFIGTLTEVKNYSLEASKLKLYKAIVEAGFKIDAESFLDAYSQSHEKYRILRYQQLIEVANNVWISDALNKLGFNTDPNDPRIKTAVNVFFEDYLNSLELRPCAKKLLEKVSAEYKLGLISNFTHAPVIYAGLRKLDINRFFSAVLVSEEVGYRKPHVKIFEEALRRLASEPEETVYIGDSPLEDIKGAKALGMRTVFIPSQFYSLKNLRESQQQPDLIVNSICELTKKVLTFLKSDS
ncbi:MAG: HAD family hydrolase [Candidatus Bathyarchaeia archaeon]